MENGKEVRVMDFEEERQTYESKLPDLLSKKGEWVLIQGKNVVDTFVSYEDAIKVGYSKFKMERFFVKKIEEKETVSFISRNIKIASHNVSP